MAGLASVRFVTLRSRKTTVARQRSPGALPAMSTQQEAVTGAWGRLVTAPHCSQCPEGQ